ncbi:hypothetical protein [Mangrovibrevibacter kandeliae]|uniref:hypothetical protein n=1 Tax=Mangrovibrevibacter kandeliae TaxID=2968473 RepID=UPI002119ACAD|nr:hypothetical protein [Aurantimonas sp. CSK15Z-1]MCQ8781273.1 hypothetical protein [Aurantimonas sp. CSK15Z-1]
MARSSAVIAAAGLAALLIGAAGSASAEDLTYRNERFGTSATFPHEAFPTALPAPTSGDGRAWVSDNGAELYIYARHNTDGETPASIIKWRAGDDTVTYAKHGNSWAVVSGYRDGKIFYERYIFRGDTIHSVAIRYPERLRSRYDDLVGPVTMTLRGGSSS